MAKIDVGTSNKDVLKFQKSLNNALNGSIVPENGSFDEDTVAGLKKFQKLEGIPATGKPDKATFKAIDDALNPRILVVYKGKKMLLTKQQYDALKACIAANLKGPANTYVNVARDLQSAWKRHDKARKDHWFFSTMVDVAVGGRGFPPKSVIKMAMSAATGIQSAVAKGDPGAIKAAWAKESKIREAAAAMSQYEDELYGGGAGLIQQLENIRDGCKVTLAVSAALLTGGASLKVQVGVATAMGAYNEMLGEVSKAGTDHKQTWASAFGNIVVAGAIGGTVTRLMGGAAGKALFKSMGEKVAAAAGPALQKMGKEVLIAYVAKSIEGGAKSAVEGGLKNLAKACDPSSKMTLNDVATLLAKDFVKGAALGALNTKFADFGKNVFKNIPASAWKGLGDVNYEEAMKAGGEQVLSQAYDLWAPVVFNSSKYPPKPKKLLDELTKKITSDRKVQKKIEAIAKKLEKKKKK